MTPASGAPAGGTPKSGADGALAAGLEVTGLCVEVAGREILHHVDLTVAPGEVHAVMGPNGSGKTTLASAVMGRPGFTVTAGRIVVDGTDVTTLTAWRRARAGLFLAPQHPVEVPGVALADLLEAATLSKSGGSVAAGSPAGRPDGAKPDGVGTLAAGSRVARPDGDELAAHLVAEAERIGLDERLLRRAVNEGLSGGERKRSETVQLGVLRPRYCVLDEIDSGLDVDALGAVARRVEEATAEWGLGVVAVTHFRRLLTELHADAVHVLVDGRIVADGGPELAEELEATGYRAYAGSASTD